MPPTRSTKEEKSGAQAAMSVAAEVATESEREERVQVSREDAAKAEGLKNKANEFFKCEEIQ